MLRGICETLDCLKKTSTIPLAVLRCLSQLPRSIEQGIVSLLRLFGAGRGSTGRNNKSAMIALGADHGAVELKQCLKQHLERAGRPSVADLWRQFQRVHGSILTSPKP